MHQNLAQLDWTGIMTKGLSQGLLAVAKLLWPYFLVAAAFVILVGYLKSRIGRI